METIDLGLIGNCSVGALIDARASMRWACLPRFDGDPVFCALLREPLESDAFGFWSIDLCEMASSEQSYLDNTAILVTCLYDRSGGAIEIRDFAPRFAQYGRSFMPVMLVRRVRRVSGNPRIVVRLRPAFDYGALRPRLTFGSHHVRYEGPAFVLRLTTDVSITAVLEEFSFSLADEATFVLGLDESVPEAPARLAQRFEDETAAYWRDWVRSLSIPFEWQDAVIRAAITLKLNAYEDTGAIVAALTTSIPESADSGRTWDYRYCWLRDGYFVINALNRLGSSDTMERYLAYVMNVAAAAAGGRLQPVYGIDGRPLIDEREVSSLPGYRGMGPVRVGNQAYQQIQHDAYGSAILTATHVFFDRRLHYAGDAQLFRRLELLGYQALSNFDQPDASLWELRGALRRHTFSAVLCWAACDRLARIATRLGADDKAAAWRAHAARLQGEIARRAWDDKRGSFVATLDGESTALDASLLLLAEFGFVAADDPRFAGTVAAIEHELKHGDFIFRYIEPDDFGTPSNAFVVCTFWYVYALCAQGRTQEARAQFERLLAHRNRLGLLAEHIDPRSGEHWGNYVQTYSMVGLINAALRLSQRWDQAF